MSSLQARMSRVHAASYQTFRSELANLRTFIERSGPLKAIAQSIDEAALGFDPNQWVTAWNLDGEDFPETEPEFMKLLQHLLRRFTTDVDFRHLGHKIFHEGNFDAIASEIAQKLVQPYVVFLAERLGTESEILHTIARYTQRLEWFTQAELFAAYNADTSKGEALYDRDFRRFLFEQGIDNPFSAPVSPSGRADVVALLDTTDPLVTEVKLYNASSYTVAYVAKGLKQAHRYARDYGKSTAHLVVFNLSEEVLQFPTDHPEFKGPPSLSVAAVRVYVHVVQAMPLPAASEPGKLKARPIQRAELVHELEDSGT
jgi:hypothetical protein